MRPRLVAAEEDDLARASGNDSRGDAAEHKLAQSAPRMARQGDDRP